MNTEFSDGVAGILCWSSQHNLPRLSLLLKSIIWHCTSVMNRNSKEKLPAHNKVFSGNLNKFPTLWRVYKMMEVHSILTWLTA